MCIGITVFHSLLRSELRRLRDCSEDAIREVVCNKLVAPSLISIACAFLQFDLMDTSACILSQVIQFFEQCFGSSDASNHFWGVVKARLMAKYIGAVALSEDERQDCYDLRFSVSHRVSKHMI